jgi:glucuronate isomerase
MFTSEPSLIQKIERMIRDTKIVDPLSHIRCDQPNAPDLASLLSYPALSAELEGVGQPRADRDPNLPADERVRRAIPYLKCIRNTSTAWAFYRILRDLYDFHEPHLDTDNYRDLCEKVSANAKVPQWSSHVLKDRCNLDIIVTGHKNQATNATSNPTTVKYRFDAHELFSAAHHTKKTDYFKSLTALLGEGLTNPDVLAQRLKDRLTQLVTGDVLFSSSFLPINHRLEEPDDVATAKVLARTSTGGDVDSDDVDVLVKFVSWNALEWHHEHRKPLQLLVGSEYLPSEKRIPRFQGSWSSDMAKTFERFNGIRFDIMMGSDVLSHEVALLARQFSNVYVSGYWQHNFFPPTIEKIVELRLQLTPMSKFTGFSSDASTVEWTYGNLALVSKSMAGAFARLIDSRAYELHEIPPILQQILHQSPIDLYGLK